ncbi:metal ABC transporter permease [bacterium]|nr:metal ABC transporter permease [bacterium]MBU1071954.1 metal ABC transporter permease [bacterium]MBU1675231.1 metal ABC transporter permease [bacterium]
MMAAPIATALVLVAMHSHLGYHVVRRGVIFVDIALAQVAAFGVAIALLMGGEIGTGTTWAVALGSTFLGALLISRTRTRNHTVPQEAYIGIIYAVFSAAMILVLTQVPHGGEEIRHLLVGAILWVTWPVFFKTAALYGLMGLLLWIWRGPLLRISTNPRGARSAGLRLRRWDLLFYMILGTVVTSSVQIAGVLLVFTLLVVPTVMGMRLFGGMRVQFLYTLAVGVLAVAIGSAASYALDLPTGAAIVCTFGLLLGAQVLIEPYLKK